MLTETGAITDRPSGSLTAILRGTYSRAKDILQYQNTRFNNAIELIGLDYEAFKTRNRLRFLGDYLQAEDYPQLAEKYRIAPEYEYIRVLQERVMYYYKDPDHVSLILRAAEFGENEKRRNESSTGNVKKRESTGRDAYEHPVEVATVAMDHLYEEFGVLLSPDVIVAILLHDSMEDDNVSYESICSNFGVRVADIVFRMTKIKGDQFEGMDPFEAEALTVERLLKCMQHDPHGEMPPDLVVLLIKFFDREVNSRTFKEMKDKRDASGKIVETAADRQRRKGEETLHIYYTLADYFRMWKLRDQMGDRSFECVDPEGYRNAKRLQDSNSADVLAIGENIEKIIDRYSARVPYVRAYQDRHLRRIRRAGVLDHFVPKVADIRTPSAYEIHQRIFEEGMTADEALRPTIYIDAQNHNQRGKLFETLLRFNPYSGQVNYETAQEDAVVVANQDQLTIRNFNLTPDQRVTIVLRNAETSWVTNMPLALRVQFPPTADSVLAERITYSHFSSHFTPRIGEGVVDRIDVFLDEIRKKDLTYVYVVNGYKKDHLNFAERVLLKEGATVLDYLCRKYSLEEIESFSEIYIFDPLTGKKNLINDRLGDVLPRGCYVLLSKNKRKVFHYKPNPRDLFCQKTDPALDFILRRMSEHVAIDENYLLHVEDSLIERGKGIFSDALFDEVEGPDVQNPEFYVDELFDFFSNVYGSEFKVKVFNLALSYDTKEREHFLSEVMTFINQRSINLALYPGSSGCYTAELSDFKLLALREYVESVGGVMPFEKTVSANGSLRVILRGYLAIREASDLPDIVQELSKYIKTI